MAAGATYYPGRTGVQEWMPDADQHRRQIARLSNAMLAGHNNATLSVTLTASAASTTIKDVRISLQTAPLMVPMTAHAAVEIASGGLYVTPTAGQVVITHANNTQTDRTFQMALIG